MVRTAAGAAEGAVRRWVEAAGGHLVLDGGLATELEANGVDLNDPLWSAKCLLSSSHLIRKASHPPTEPQKPHSWCEAHSAAVLCFPIKLEVGCFPAICWISTLC